MFFNTKVQKVTGTCLLLSKIAKCVLFLYKSETLSRGVVVEKSKKYYNILIKGNLFYCLGKNFKELTLFKIFPYARSFHGEWRV